MLRMIKKQNHILLNNKIKWVVKKQKTKVKKHTTKRER